MGDADKRRITDQAVETYLKPWQRQTGISGDVVNVLKSPDSSSALRTAARLASTWSMVRASAASSKSAVA